MCYLIPFFACNDLDLWEHAIAMPKKIIWSPNKVWRILIILRSIRNVTHGTVAGSGLPIPRYGCHNSHGTWPHQESKENTIKFNLWNRGIQELPKRVVGLVHEHGNGMIKKGRLCASLYP